MKKDNETVTKYAIDALIDCVFKAILGREENKLVLIDFLNAVITPKKSITEVTILNPYNEREFLTDKLSIIDIKAKDSQGRIFQIEVQLSSPSYLSKRILYTWAQVYRNQLVACPKSFASYFGNIKQNMDSLH